MTAKKKCTDCNGTGRCKHCKGTGKTPGGNKCTWCSTFAVHNTKEQGSGVCNRCKGKGET